MNIKEFLKAFYILITLKPYTAMPRPLEIAYGLLAWAILLMYVILFKTIFGL